MRAGVEGGGVSWDGVPYDSRSAGHVADCCVQADPEVLNSVNQAVARAVQDLKPADVPFTVRVTDAATVCDLRRSLHVVAALAPPVVNARALLSCARLGQQSAILAPPRCQGAPLCVAFLLVRAWCARLHSGMESWAPTGCLPP